MRPAFSGVTLWLVGALLTVGSNRVDQKKFDGVYRAAKALEVDIDITDGVSVAQSRVLLKQLQTEVSLLQGRTNGQREADALAAYVEAADAYSEFLRFRFLDLHGDTDPDGRKIIMGEVVDVAAKYQLPTETRGDTKWVDTGAALRLLSAAAKSKVTRAAQILNGQT